MPQLGNFLSLFLLTDISCISVKDIHSMYVDVCDPSARWMV